MQRKSLGRKQIIGGLIALAIVLASAELLTWRSGMSPFASPVYAATCNYDDNLDELAQQFIGRCCLGSINSEFPGQYYNVSLQTIKNEKNNGVGAAIKAYKLLNDNRFRK